jgi:hypothetical protein
LDGKSRMSREVQVRFCGGQGVRFPLATRQSPPPPAHLIRGGPLGEG